MPSVTDTHPNTPAVITSHTIDRPSVRSWGVSALESHLAHVAAHVADTDSLAGCSIRRFGDMLQREFIDGKMIRGTSAHGDPVHVVSCVQHSSAITLGQVRMPHMHNERTAVPRLLADQCLHGRVLTVDARHIQRIQDHLLAAALPILPHIKLCNRHADLELALDRQPGKRYNM